MCICLICALFSCALLTFTLVFLKFVKLKSGNTDLTGKHVLITGGSKGIGKALAIEVFKRGASITLFARNAPELEKTKAEVLLNAKSPKNQQVSIVSIDLTADYQRVEKAILDAESKLGPIEILVNCVGNAVSLRFEETPISDFKKMMDVNYFGPLHCTKAVIPLMKSRKRGRILYFSSIAGLVGIYGFSAYSASKFALIGFAQSLLMEVKHLGINITVALPPDTDTPGYAVEQETKPLETQLISEGGGLYQPHVIARQALEDSLDGKFLSTVGFESFMVKTAASGMMPLPSLPELIFQICTMGLFRIVAVIFYRKSYGIVESCANQKSQEKKGK